MSYVENATRCGTCTIRHKSICAALSADEINALNRISRRRLVPAGQTILGEGEANTIFANIVSGVVKLTKTLDDGRVNEVNIGWVDAAALVRALHRKQLAAGMRLGFAGHAAA